jgi:putative FmdB family regulatory protein
VPIYEYRCEKCHEVTEIITRSISSPFKAVCAECGSKKMERLVSRIIPHQTEATKLEQLDPKYDRWVDDSNAQSRRKARQDIAEVRAKEAKVRRDAKAQREKKKIV